MALELFLELNERKRKWEKWKLRYGIDFQRPLTIIVVLLRMFNLKLDFSRLDRVLAETVWRSFGRWRSHCCRMSQLDYEALKRKFEFVIREKMSLMLASMLFLFELTAFAPQITGRSSSSNPAMRSPVSITPPLPWLWGGTGLLLLEMKRHH